MRQGFIGFVLILFAAGVSAFGADAVTIKIPCDQSPFLSCASLRGVLLDGSSSTAIVDADRTAIVPGVAGLRKTVRDLMDDVYSGKTKAELQPDGSTTCMTVNVVGKPPLCPPIKVAENACVDEFTKNAKGEACAPISKVGEVTTDKYYYTLGHSSSGSLETANIAGGLVVAISNQAVEVEKEVAANALVIAPDSPCYSQATALGDLIAAQSNVQLIAQIKACDVSSSNTCSVKSYFNANLGNIESAYLLLARCRISDEAAKKFRSFALDYPTRIEGAVVKDCFRSHLGDPPGMRRCYADQYRVWVQSAARAAFPNVAAACR